MLRRALALAAVLLAAVPAGVSAHATLVETIPARGAELAQAPRFVELRFSESVETEFGSVRVFDARGRQVQTGNATRPGGKGSVVRIALKDGLPDGGYTTTFRVISADSHPVSSGFVFAVGDGPTASASVDELLEGTAAGPLTTTALSVMRALQYLAIALGAGALIFLLGAWRPALRESAARADGAAGSAWATADGAFTARIRRLLLVAATLGIASAAGGIVLQGATAGGTSVWSAFSPDVVADVLGTRFGSFWGTGLLAWAATLVLAVGRAPTVALALPLGLLAALPALAGHASVQSPRGLLLPANVVHVVAMSTWLGGIAVLVLALRAATSEVEPGDRARLLAATVERFSSLAGLAVAAVAVTGVIQSIVYLSGFGQLLDTPFGRSVLIKAILFVVIVGLGYFNRSRLLPRLRAATTPGQAGIALRRVLRAELAIGLAIIAVTGALAGYPPSTAADAGPFSSDTSLGPQARLETTVDPASPGLNEMHVYLFDRKTGAQWEKTQELTVRASLPDKQIAPVDFEAVKSGPGHYTITGATFGITGDWIIEVTARVSDFDQYTTKIEVPIR